VSRYLSRRLDRIEATSGPEKMVIVWVRPEDTEKDIAAKIEERKAAFTGERLSVQVLR